VNILLQLSAEFVSERILKIGQYLAKIWTRAQCHVFSIFEWRDQLSQGHRAMLQLFWWDSDKLIVRECVERSCAIVLLLTMWIYRHWNLFRGIRKTGESQQSLETLWPGVLACQISERCHKVHDLAVFCHFLSTLIIVVRCVSFSLQRKLLAIYLHHDQSIFANVFCSQVLCAESLVSFLSANFITWAWDLTHASNREKYVLS